MPIKRTQTEPISPGAPWPTDSEPGTGSEATTAWSKEPDPLVSLEPMNSEIAREPVVSKEYMILVYGATGSGKSSFIRATSGCEVRVGHDIVSCR